MKKKNKMPTQMSLLMYMVVGGYLLYTAWDLRGAFQDGPQFILFAAVFVVIGAALAGYSIKKFVKKEYVMNAPFFAPQPENKEAGDKGEEKNEE